MKRLFSVLTLFLLTLILLFTNSFSIFATESVGETTTVFSEETTEKETAEAPEFDERKFGDINSDGVLTAADARILLRCSVSLESISDYISTYGDYTADGKITSEDARLSLRVSVALDCVKCILHGHTLSPHKIQATCLTEGYTTNKCNFCTYSDGSKTETTAATGHKLITKTTKADCVNNGITTTYCEACNHKASETVTENAYEHKFSIWEIHDNSKSKVCKSCGHKVTSDKAKTVYLTFDDGPGPYTEKLLGYLREYNVKATFFVTNQMPRYKYLIKKIADDGHTLGVHTLTHQWNIYSSRESYLKDFNTMHKIIKDETGIDTKIFRFPGGTNNTVSRSYSKGIMATMSKTMTDMGYSYYDWNVDCCDTLGYSSTQIANTTISQLKNRKTSIVLMHDIKNTTVEAVKNIIRFGLDNGYEFMAIDESTPPVRFSPVN